MHLGTVFTETVTYEYSLGDHVIQRKVEWPVGPVAVCKWPIFTARVIAIQNKVSVG